MTHLMMTDKHTELGKQHMIPLHTFKVLATNLAIWPSASITKDNRSLSLKYLIFLSPAPRNMQHLVSMAVLGKSDLPTSQSLIVQNTSKTKKLTCDSHSISVNNDMNYSNAFAYFRVTSNTLGCCLNRPECSVGNQPSGSLWGNESVIHGKINLHTGCL